MIEVTFRGETRDAVQAAILDFLGIELVQVSAEKPAGTGNPPPPPVATSTVYDNPAPTPIYTGGPAPLMTQQQFIDHFRTWAQSAGVPAAKVKLEALGVKYVTDVPPERYSEVLASLPAVVK